MSKVYVGMDMAKGNDQAAYVVCRGLRWYDRLLRKLRLSHATWTIKVLRMGRL